MRRGRTVESIRAYYRANWRRYYGRTRARKLEQRVQFIEKLLYLAAIVVKERIGPEALRARSAECRIR